MNNIHNIIYGLFGKIKSLPNYTKYKNCIFINPTHIQIITRNKIYYVRNTPINRKKVNLPVFDYFIKIDKTNQVLKEVS
jgi:hypothetical protein